MTEVTVLMAASDRSQPREMKLHAGGRPMKAAVSETGAKEYLAYVSPGKDQSKWFQVPTLPFLYHLYGSSIPGRSPPGAMLTAPDPYFDILCCNGDQSMSSTHGIEFSSSCGRTKEMSFRPNETASGQRWRPPHFDEGGVILTSYTIPCQLGLHLKWTWEIS